MDFEYKRLILCHSTKRAKQDKITIEFYFDNAKFELNFTLSTFYKFFL